MGGNSIIGEVHFDCTGNSVTTESFVLCVVIAFKLNCLFSQNHPLLEVLYQTQSRAMNSNVGKAYSMHCVKLMLSH